MPLEMTCGRRRNSLWYWANNTSETGLAVLAILHVLLPVEHPHGNLELERVLDDGDKALDLIVGELAGPDTETWSC